MALLQKIDRLKLRKRRLVAQNDFLRRSLSADAEKLQTAAVWIEQGCSAAQFALENLQSLSASENSKPGNRWINFTRRIFSR